jgi:hypothetical protein
MEKLMSFISRLFFLASFVLVTLALFDRVLNLFGYTILRGGYTSGRMLEFAAIMLIVVIALLLRQIRETLKRTEA